MPGTVTHTTVDGWWGLGTYRKTYYCHLPKPASFLCLKDSFLYLQITVRFSPIIKDAFCSSGCRATTAQKHKEQLTEWFPFPAGTSTTLWQRGWKDWKGQNIRTSAVGYVRQRSCTHEIATVLLSKEDLKMTSDILSHEKTRVDFIQLMGFCWARNLSH